MADMAAPDIKLLRTEVDSLSARVQRLNAENDDLLQRLSEAKSLKEQRERQFEEEKSHLTRRIRELELSLKNGDESVQEAKERIMNERKEHQVNQQVLRLEIDHLKSTLESMTVELSEARAESDYVRRHTVSVDRERELRKQVEELMASLERESKNHHESTKTGQSEISRLVDGEIELKRRFDESRRHADELRGQLEREKKRASELQKDLDELQRQRSTSESELRSEVDRMSAALKTNERLLDEARLERKTMLSAKEELNAQLAAQDLEYRSQVERLTVTIHDKERSIEESNWKRREMLTSVENLERNQVELRKALNDARTRSQELEERNGKLERAIIRQRFEKDQQATKNREDMLGMDGDLRDLVREQQSHIGDLQKEVNMLRSSLKDVWRGGPGETRGRGGSIGQRTGQAAASMETVPRRGVGGSGEQTRRSPRRASLDRETARLTRAAADVTSPNELLKAKSEIDNGARRIAQLEKWLDQIYNDRELGLGPTAQGQGQGHRGQHQRSKFQATSTGQTTLPELAPPYTQRTRTERRDDKPDWDQRTKLSTIAGTTAV